MSRLPQKIEVGSALRTGRSPPRTARVSTHVPAHSSKCYAMSSRPKGPARGERSRALVGEIAHPAAAYCWFSNSTQARLQTPPRKLPAKARLACPCSILALDSDHFRAQDGSCSCARGVQHHRGARPRGGLLPEADGQRNCCDCTGTGRYHPWSVRVRAAAAVPCHWG